ncbi:putative Capsule polysaccharide biosynthesis protein [Seiridium cardinale]|uniref:Capsule polysaccharide biosynthesis protein n=1 Tax=Seiridium cardinale TaxID=138064 RepID=A0ABR2XTI5_9PEZI
MAPILSCGGLNPKLRPLDQVDERTDEQIVHGITHPPVVTSEQNVWAFWDKGFEAMPPWQKRNVLGWARMLGPRWTIRVLTLTESPANIFNFLDGVYLPKHLNDGKTTGRYAGANTSDTIRLPCIYQHGGVWMDLGIILLMHLDQVCWAALKDPQFKFEVAVASADATLKSGIAENFFIAGRKGNGFIKRWMLILLEAWTGRINNKGLHAHPLFSHLIRDGNISHIFRGASGDKLDYFQAYLAWERLRLLEDPYDGFSGPNYCKNRVLLIDYREFASAAMLANDSGPKQFEFFSTRHDQDKDSDQYKDAQKYFEHLLSNAAMLKLYHWRDHDVPTLADLWDRPKNHGADCLPNTFGEYLRHLSSRYTQDRKINVIKFPRITEEVLVAGVLETFED